MSRFLIFLVSALVAGILAYFIIDYYGLGGIFGDPPLGTKLVFAALAGVAGGAFYWIGQKWSHWIMAGFVLMLLLCWFTQRMAGVQWSGLLLASAAVGYVFGFIRVRPGTSWEEPHGRFTGE